MAPSSTHSRSPKSPAPPSTPPATEVIVHVYDLLPPSRLASLLWTLSTPLVHTSLHLPPSRHELAFGGHPHPNITGVYTTPVLSPPPGARHRTTLHLGLSRLQPWELTAAIEEACALFKGTEYNLLTRNCNHFTDHLARRLCGKGLPGWCNRAAAVGVALPCLVPADWVVPPAPQVEVEGEAGEGVDESTAMLTQHHEGQSGADRGRKQSLATVSTGMSRETTPPARLVSLRDNEGRELPVAERAPVPASGTLERRST
ncbi:DeSI-like protein [Elsinoe fawcettii]|nr:DeSI-like protein [Elsinoe fawcettii]